MQKNLHIWQSIINNMIGCWINPRLQNMRMIILHRLKEASVDLGDFYKIVVKSLTNRLAIVGVLLAHFRILKTSGVGNDLENHDFLSELGPLYYVLSIYKSKCYFLNFFQSYFWGFSKIQWVLQKIQNRATHLKQPRLHLINFT